MEGWEAQGGGEEMEMLLAPSSQQLSASEWAEREIGGGGEKGSGRGGGVLEHVVGWV